MQRILVMGVSSGVGKSTFARKLGEKLDVDVYHLDAFFWKPGWVEASLDEFRASQEQIVSNEDKWIIEGNYSNTYDTRMSKADTIIYLELPLRVCLYRVVKRWLLNVGKTRPDMGEGCPEKIDYDFIKFIVTTYGARKEKMRKRFEIFKEINPHNKVIILQTKKEIKDYLETV